MTDITYEITIDAAPEVVYAHLTQADGLLRWMAIDATADPRPGGALSWTHENGATMIGRFIELDPPHRVVFSYGWRDDLMAVPPESTTVEIRLAPAGRGTHLHLVHSDLPPSSAAEHRHGWAHFLPALEPAVRAGST